MLVHQRVFQFLSDLPLQLWKSTWKVMWWNGLVVIQHCSVTLDEPNSMSPITRASPSKILCLCSWELHSNFKTNVLFMPETSRCWLNGTLSCLIGRSGWISALPEPKEQPFPQSQSIYRKLLASFTEGHSGRNKESRKKRARLARPQVEGNQITAEQSQLLLFRPGVTTQCQLDMGMAQDKEDKEDTKSSSATWGLAFPFWQVLCISIFWQFKLQTMIL